MPPLPLLSGNVQARQLGVTDANRELMEWMRQYNADATNSEQIRFYGIDAPTENDSADSPRHALIVALEYLSSLDEAAAEQHREKIESFLGNDADWENPEAMRDPSKAIGLSSDATDLQIATEDLAMELRIKRPELVKKSSQDRYHEAFHHVSIAQYLLNYHAAMAADEPLGTMMEIRDSLMTKNIGHIVECERHKGKILIFAHNSHLQRSKAVWPWFEFWPVGSHLDVIFGSHYAVIGSALGVSDENGIAEPEDQTLEA
ncbi:erythromycin esterase family protein [Haladaptatus halobius]|uniref:erythromycin esterase family protein n=1 Tax=Haladaptatus halobius TaxID=2884875 RepID=UPI001D0B8301